MIRRSAPDSARAVWGASPAGTTFAAGASPGTREWFDRARETRSSVEMPWLLRIVPFDTFRDNDVLEIGCGAGFDAYEFIRHGARYTGLDITPENIDRTTSHLRTQGLEADHLVVGDAMSLPFERDTFDIVFSNGVLHHVADIDRSLHEASRVLRPGGDLWMTLYHRHSAFYVLTLCLYGWILRGKRHLFESFEDYLATIEFTTADARPLVRAYSRAEVDKMLWKAGFDPRRLCVRKLLRDDLPSPRFLRGWPWRAIPQTFLDVLGTQFGWYVVAHARKPRSL
jgi:ubiquinone/menaquinone biosynthesis C-methylase UbiE